MGGLNDFYEAAYIFTSMSDLTTQGANPFASRFCNACEQVLRKTPTGVHLAAILQPIHKVDEVIDRDKSSDEARRLVYYSVF